MTLKYESEILFDLMKRDGDATPSDVLPYESELKEKYLQQVEGAYPKLQDYRSEWLNYNLNGHIPAYFPIESVSNVTNATFENVVPYAYGSAILKGCTLVNVVSSCWFADSTKYFGIELNNYKNNQSYMVIMFNVPNNIKRIYIGNLDGSIIWSDYTKNFIKNKNCIMLKITCPSNYDGTSILPHFKYEDDEHPSSINNIECMLIEYQEGMENWDIPYFEGMQTVKMPVLTTTGKNIFSPTKMTINDGALYGYYKYKDDESVRCTLSIADKDTSVDIGELYLGMSRLGKNSDGGVEWLISGGSIVNPEALEIVSNYNFISLYPNNTETLNKLTERFNIQLEHGEAKTSYEPHKSNILTVNEEVELRGIGNVQDTLDLMTGELTERIGEVVLDGSEEWILSTSKDKTQVFRLSATNSKLKKVKINGLIMCDKLKVAPGVDDEIISLTSTLYIALLKSKVSTVEELKVYLSQNPITFIHELATESIKTVDLTVTDQDGNIESNIRPIEGTMHVNTSSQELPPLLDMSVPVEATTQNLMSFANILEEE